MPPRPPIAVEVATKIPVRTGLGLADPGVTGGLSAVQTATSRAAVEVVTDVPGQLRNITPISFGQKVAQIGKVGVSVGSKILGVGLGVISNLATDLLFPDPVGEGSDMVGGVKIGSQPKAAPATTTSATQPIAKPQVTTAPFKPPAPVVAPVSTPQKPKPQAQTKPQTQTQTTQPIPFPTTTQPQSAPAQTRPRPQPQPITTPAPRSALETPAIPRQKKITKDSPYPLNFVDLDSYGGVNLTYPIAQKLTGLTEEITSILQPDLEQIQFDLQDLPQKFEDILKRARIETTVNLPAKVDLISQIPLQLDFSKQIPVNIDLSKSVPITVDLKKEVPVSLDLSSQIPLQLDFSKQVPVTVDLTKNIPVTVDLNSKIPFQIDLSKSVPVAVNLSKQIPVTVNLKKEVPVTVDLNAILQPNSSETATSLKELQECCEAVQKTLKKKAEMFEGNGEFVCDKNSTPYSYRGEGLNGIHQLMKIMLDANKQILGKICLLDKQTIIAGSGTYHCGTLPPIPYHYSGIGLLGIQSQVEQLFNLDKKILGEVCSITELTSSLPTLGSLPNISGKIEYFDCDYTTHTILYSGNGIEGLSKQVDALSSLVKVGLKASCDTFAIPLMPDARFEQFTVTRQLVITWGTKYPTQNGSLWHSSIPNPVAGLDWCKDFETLSMTKGQIFGRLFWDDSKMHTGIYCDTEEEARRIIARLAAFSNAIPEKDEEGALNPRISKGGKIKRKPAIRTLRAVRAAIVEIGANGESETVLRFTPPPQGCLPVII